MVFRARAACTTRMGVQMGLPLCLLEIPQPKAGGSRISHSLLEYNCLLALPGLTIDRSGLPYQGLVSGGNDAAIEVSRRIIKCVERRQTGA
jgi:hypothetical protein